MNGLITNVSPIDGGTLFSDTFDVHPVPVLPGKKDQVKPKSACLGRVHNDQPGQFARPKKGGQAEARKSLQKYKAIFRGPVSSMCHPWTVSVSQL
jgi:hypothetical protein